jgi:hypothetical protein
MLFDLSEQERRLLIGLVEREITDLGPEIRRTRTASVRDDLKGQKEIYRHLLEHLHMMQTGEPHVGV